jgi:hypothetical protein
MNNNLEELEGEELDFLKFKRLFLLEFTRQLIKNSAHSDIIRLQTILEKEDGRKYEEEKKKIERKRKYIPEKYKEEETEGERSIMHPAIGMFESQKTPEKNLFKDTFKKEQKPAEKIKRAPVNQQSQQFTALQTTTPQVNYVNRTQNEYAYTDPFKKLSLWIPEPRLPPHIQYLKPTPIKKSIDLGKLNPLINDRFVKTIECHGPGENIIVKGSMGTKKTGIILSKEEIEDIIQRFSKETKIPVQEGIYKVVSGILIFLAIISEVTDKKFTINKMSPDEMNQ